MVSSTLQVFLMSFSAMTKVAILSSVGILCCIYPKDSPILTPQLTKGLSRLSNFVLIPALITASLGSTVTVPLLQRFGILIVMCVIVMLISYMNTWAFKWLHEDNRMLFSAVMVAVGSPNAISIPLLVMKTMCEDDTINADFTGDSLQCFKEASSMMFIYSIGWHTVYWTYGYPRLKSLDPSIIQSDSFLQKLLYNVVFSPSLIAIYLGILIAVIPNLQDFMFKTPSPLRPFGASILTLAEPVVCLNTLIMSASLAQVYFAIMKNKVETKTDSHLSSTSAQYSISPLHSFSRIESTEMTNIFEYPSLPVEIEVDQYSHSEGSQVSSTELKLTKAPQLRSVAVMIICRSA
jgi:predicted permease